MNSKAVYSAENLKKLNGNIYKINGFDIRITNRGSFKINYKKVTINGRQYSALDYTTASAYVGNQKFGSAINIETGKTLKVEAEAKYLETVKHRVKAEVPTTSINENIKEVEVNDTDFYNGADCGFMLARAVIGGGHTYSALKNYVKTKFVDMSDEQFNEILSRALSRKVICKTSYEYAGIKKTAYYIAQK